MRPNELRGKLLSFLNNVYPEKVEEMTVISVHYEYHEVDDIKKALEYLTDKGFIVREEKPHPYKKRKTVYLYKLSPDGTDLQEGITEDPGVSVGEW